MSAATESAIGRLVAAYPVLVPVLAEHLEDNFGEMLPNLVMSDVIRWLVAHLESDPGVCRSVLEWMESAFQEGPDDVRGLIVVSGVEMIPDPGEPGSGLRATLGPHLVAIDPWMN